MVELDVFIGHAISFLAGIGFVTALIAVGYFL